MNGSASARTLSHLWLVTIAVLAVAVLYLAKILLLPLGIAILFAFLLAPVVGFFERLCLPRPVAAVFVMLAFVAVLGVITWALFSQFIAIVNDLPTYRNNITQKMQALHSPGNSAFGRAQHEIQIISDQLGIANSTASAAAHPPGQHDDDKPIGTTPEKPVQVREVPGPPGRLNQLGGIIEPAAMALLTVVFTFFVLLQREDLRNRLIRLSGVRNLGLMTQAMMDASRRISRYFALLLTVNLTYGCIIFLVLHFIGMPHALLFGALTALLRFVPYVGAPVAALMPTLLSIAVFHGWRNSALIFGTYLLIEIVTSNYLEPRIYGHHTGLSSLAVLIAASFWTLIWGPIGLALSVPLTVCLVVMGSHVPSLEFLTVLLGDQPVIPAYTSFYQRLLARDEREARELLDNGIKSEPLVAVYDSILLPALTLVEKERQTGNLDDATLDFIRNATLEMVDDLGYRALEENGQQAAESAANAEFSVTPGNSAGSAKPAKPAVIVLPVRDGADELVATMLTQVLSVEGFRASCDRVRSIDQSVAQINEEKPDIVFLSGLPPVAMARAGRLYRRLRAAQPTLRIIIGIWQYSDDPAKAAQMISRTEEPHVSTSLTDAITHIQSPTEPQPAVAKPLDQDPQLASTPKDNAA
jgi:predicted PurR-regulated permease PerM